MAPSGRRAQANVPSCADSPRQIFQRYWNGERWTQHTQPFPDVYQQQAIGSVRDQDNRRRSYWSAIVRVVFAILVGFFVLLPVHESIEGTSISCGNAFHAMSIDATAVDKSLPDLGDPAANSLASSLAESTVRQCNSDGRDRLVWAAGLFVGGVVLSVTVGQHERRR